MIQADQVSNDIAELDSLDGFMDWVKERHPGEQEYHQAVRGVAEKAVELGAKVVTLSNREGTLYKDAGLSDGDVTRIKREYRNGTGLAELAQATGAELREGEKPWGVDCDIAVPSATQNELDEDDAQRLIDGSCRVVVEGANMPLTTDAARRLVDSNVPILPGKAANAGGVAVSGFEMSQNRIGQPWSVKRLENELRDVMQSIYEQTRTNGEIDGRVDYRRGADRAGFCRLATAIASFGAV
jgi:glutamate dehydrogenase (NADP+)